jgi:cation:H+ antiporter
MSASSVLLSAAGAGLLIAGAELLVRGASRLATAAGVSPLVAGLTVVAFGTSSPELAVTVGSAYAGEGGVALGNVVGSNIFNVLFILGVSALIAPLAVARQLVRLDVPIMIGASLLTALLALDGRIGRIEGLLLVGGIVGYTLFLVRQTRRSGATPPDRSGEEPTGAGAGDAEADEGETHASLPKNALLALAGLGLLVLGARWLVEGAVVAATALGVDELVIGLTVVAAGTSLPEVATSVLATLRGERDIAVGNVVGSNIFNLFAVLGLGSVVASGGIAVPPGALTFDVPVMGAVALATLPVFFTGGTISRWEGGVFLGYYVAYTACLVLQATGHAALASFRTAMLWFVVPLTALTLGVAGARALRGGEEPPGGTGP